MKNKATLWLLLACSCFINVNIRCMNKKEQLPDFWTIPIEKNKNKDVTFGLTDLTKKELQRWMVEHETFYIKFEELRKKYKKMNKNIRSESNVENNYVKAKSEVRARAYAVLIVFLNLLKKDTEDAWDNRESEPIEMANYEPPVNSNDLEEMGTWLLFNYRRINLIEKYKRLYHSLKKEEKKSLRTKYKQLKKEFDTRSLAVFRYFTQFVEKMKKTPKTNLVALSKITKKDQNKA